MDTSRKKIKKQLVIGDTYLGMVFSPGENWPHISELEYGIKSSTLLDSYAYYASISNGNIVAKESGRYFIKPIQIDFEQGIYEAEIRVTFAGSNVQLLLYKEQLEVTRSVMNLTPLIPDVDRNIEQEAVYVNHYQGLTVTLRIQEGVWQFEITEVGLPGKDFRFEDFTPEQIAILQQPAADATEAANVAAQHANEVADSMQNIIAEAETKIVDVEQRTQVAISATNQAEENANAKAILANNAATNADAKAGLAETATTNANNAATNADSKATLANDAATHANAKATFATDAATNANNAATNANAKAGLAETATTNANNAATNANEKATLATDAATNADSKATLATNAATNANEKATLATNAATNANEKATLANNAATNANQAAQTANNAKGWSPQFVFEEDGATRLVMKLNDYVGGTGTKPINNIGQYLTNEGTYTATKANGANFRGVMQIGSSTVVGGYKAGDTLVVSADGTLNVKPKVREILNLTFSSNTSAFVFATENARTNITDVYINGAILDNSQYEVVKLGLISVKSLPKSVVLSQSYSVIVVGDLSTEPQEFITEWEITDADKTITLPMTTAQTANLTIDWGDGTINNSNTKTYATSGKKIISIKGAVSNFRFNNSGDKLKIKDILNFGVFNINTDCVFYGCENLILNNVVGIPIISTSSLMFLFYGCKGTTTINNINTWDVSSVTSMYAMFYSSTAFNGDISNWDVSSVTNMREMFSRATAFNGDISTWDVSSVTSMHAMFYSSTAFNGDISNWDVSSVTNMKEMFYSSTAFNGDISTWDVSSVTSMHTMFYNSTAFNGDISNWDFSKVNNLSNIMTLKSYTNYNPQYVTNLYRRWTEFPNIANLTIGMGTCRYTPEGQQYKDILISRGNIITDGGIQQ